MTPDELLDRASDEMTIRGSCAGNFRNESGNICMLGAITTAVNMNPMSENVYIEARVALIHALDGTEEDGDYLPLGGFIARWNDSHTHDERIEALRQGAKYYREKMSS